MCPEAVHFGLVAGSKGRWGWLALQRIFEAVHMVGAALLTMSSSGLSAPKCPSCKIILLRPLHHHGGGSSTFRRGSSSTGKLIMHCPACRSQYSLRKGTIIPSILLTSSQPAANIAAPVAAATAVTKAGVDSVSSSPVRRGCSAGLVSPLAATLAPAHCDLLSPQHHSTLHPLPMTLPLRSHSFNSSKDHHKHRSLSPTSRISSKSSNSSPKFVRKNMGHQGTDALHKTENGDGWITLTMPLEELRRSSSSDRLHSDSERISQRERWNLNIVTTSVSDTFHDDNQSASEISPMQTIGLPPDLTRLDNMDAASCKSNCLSTIDDLLEEYSLARQNSNYDHLKELYTNTFSSSENISNTFRLHKMDCGFGINMKMVHCTYTILMEMPRSVQRAVMKSIINYFLKQSRLPKSGDDFIRAQMILLENPQFKSSSTYIIFAQLLKQISEIPTDSLKRIVAWMREEYKPDWIRYLVGNIQQFISMKLLPSTSTKLSPTSASKTHWWIPCAVRVLSLLYEAAMKCSPPMLAHTEFYNSSLDHIDLMSDFFAWRNPLSLKFIFCHYPFILSLPAKKYILQHDSQHQMLMVALRSLDAKISQLSAQNAFLSLKIRRKHLIEDSINELVKKKGDLKKKVKVTFSGEPGVDMGGLTKEWFLLLVRKVFDSQYGLFTNYEKSEYCWFSMGLNGDYRRTEYHLVGLVMGLAMYNSIILDVNLPPCCFKKLLTPPTHSEPPAFDGKTGYDSDGTASMGVVKCSLDDLTNVMPTIARSLKYLQDYDSNVEDLCFTFQVSHEMFGTIVTTELAPNGENIPVTSENRTEFIQLYTDHLLNRAIEQQFAAFYHGFHSVCNSDALKLLCPEELEALICGFTEFDIEGLQKATVYDGYREDDITIKYFWEVLEALSTSEQQKLMVFVTGSYRVPVGGMTSIQFKISKLPFPNSSTTDILPMAHTCFNQLLLPPYEDKETLKGKLIVAISNSEGFGLV